MRLLQEYFKWEEIKNNYGSDHTLSWLFSARLADITENTDAAFRHIFVRNKSWLESQKDRLLNLSSSESSSTLGELRTYGYLLMTSLTITPQGTKKGSDFIITDGTEHIYVETKTNLMCEHFKSLLEEVKNGNIRFKTSEIAPYGLPNPEKAGDSITTNAISKICSIKAAEAQLSETSPSIIWVDMQDLCHGRNIFSELSNCRPLGSSKEEITSGHIWYGLYGWKGAPVFEHFNEVDSQILRMAHNGRFTRPSKCSAFIFAFSNGTVFLENHLAKNKVPLWFKNRLPHLHRFSIEYSLIDFERAPLKHYIEYLKQYLEQVYNNFKCRC